MNRIMFVRNNKFSHMPHIEAVLRTLLALVLISLRDRQYALSDFVSAMHWNGVLTTSSDYTLDNVEFIGVRNLILFC
jgi:hypothetical protein